MEKMKGQPAGPKAVFQDLELAHKGHPLVSGPPIAVNPGFKHAVQNPNQADASMTRLIDRNGKPDYES